jgi:nicotinic acid phosphoribosyltransferase
MRELKKNERMFSSLKEGGYEAEEIDYLLNETDFYFTNMIGPYLPKTPRREKAAYKPVVHKAMRFKKNNVR